MAQTLHWMVNKVLPAESPPIWHKSPSEKIPTSGEADAARQEIYGYWISGRLKLYGTSIKKPKLQLDESTGTYAERYLLDELRSVPIRAIEDVDANSIDWECSSFRTRHRFDTHEETGVHLRWNNLRVRWADLYKLTIGEPLPTTSIEPPHSPEGTAQDEATAGARQTPKNPRGRIPRSDWPILAALSALVGEQTPAFWSMSNDNKVSHLLPILKAADHSCPGNSTVPARSAFRERVMTAVQDARGLIGQNWAPDTLPLASALMAIIREHDRDPGDIPCERDLPDQIAELIESDSNTDAETVCTLAASGVYAKAVEAARRAGKSHEKWCRKARLRPH